MDNITRNKAIKAIDKAYYSIDNVLSCVTWGNYGKEYFNLNLTEEKRHCNFKPDHIKNGLTVKQGARFFYVKEIIDFLLDKKAYIPSASEFIELRTSIFYAYSLVCKYKQELIEALKDVDKDFILSLDYAELQKTE
jgi:hypothetical protein